MESLEELRQEIDEIDGQMLALFRLRMETVRRIGAEKERLGLPVYDAAREEAALSRIYDRADDEPGKAYEAALQRQMMELSRAFQRTLRAPQGHVIPVVLPAGSYEIVLSRGALGRLDEYLDLDRRVAVVTDTGVPAAYARAVADRCRSAEILCVPQGEASKSLETLESLLRRMMDLGFTRSDCVVAVGGGVVGDLAGLTASLFMRGVDFYQIPTTLIAQADSSVGGKTAVDLAGVKNVVGSFYQPKRVVVDPDVLSTLPPRQLAAGAAEIVKIALTCDAGLFARLEAQERFSPEEAVIRRALELKAAIVTADEKESGLRRVLNFGHTLGHALESCVPGLLHGECVALGMLPMCSPAVRERLLPLLRRFGLPVSCRFDPEQVTAAAMHDKKSLGREIAAVEVEEVGSYRFVRLSENELRQRLDAIWDRGE